MEPRAQGFGILPTPDPTIASCISDEDVALQLNGMTEGTDQECFALTGYGPYSQTELMLRASHMGVPQLPPWMPLSTNTFYKQYQTEKNLTGPIEAYRSQNVSMEDFPGAIHPRSFEQKTSYKYRLVHNNNHIFEIARYDVHGDPKDENTPVHTS